jgi:hypothetical protein
LLIQNQKRAQKQNELEKNWGEEVTKKDRQGQIKNLLDAEGWIASEI